MGWVEALSDKMVYAAVGGTMAAKGADCSGSEFVTLCSGGIKEEGVPLCSGGVFETEEDAWADYLPRLSSHVNGREVVYFRAIPEAVRGESGVYIYSRVSAH